MSQGYEILYAVSSSRKVHCCVVLLIVCFALYYNKIRFFPNCKIMHFQEVQHYIILGS